MPQEFIQLSLSGVFEEPGISCSCETEQVGDLSVNNWDLLLGKSFFLQKILIDKLNLSCISQNNPRLEGRLLFTFSTQFEMVTVLRNKVPLYIHT